MNIKSIATDRKVIVTLAALMLAGVAWGQTNVIHLQMRPERPVVGQSYKFGDDPNTHTYNGGDCWSSTLLHWQEGVVYATPTETNNVIKPNVALVKRLAKSGAICAALGFHCWGTDWESVVQLVHYPDGQPQSRKCRICGKVETKQPGVWK